MDSLGLGRPVVFITLRENYAHYLSLSKKLGGSLEQYLNKGLTYYEAFLTDWCGELPLTESCPNTYAVPPTTVNCILPRDLKDKVKVKGEGCLVAVDSLKFCSDQAQFIYDLYEQVLLSEL